MYGQGNYNTQFGKAPLTPTPPLPGPPLPPSHFQLGQPAPPPSVVNPFHLPAPPPAPPLLSTYQYGPPHTSTVDHVPQGMLPHSNQSYMQPPPLHPGIIPLSHMFPTTQHNSQHPSYLGIQHMYQRPQQVPSPPPPLPLGHLPPPPPIPLQGPALYRGQVHPMPQQLAHGLFSIPRPPIPNFVTSPFGNFVHPSVPPPPPAPPSSPPPIPPSPPETTVDKAVDLNQEGTGASDAGSLVGNGVSSEKKGMTDLPPPPPKPTEEKVAQRIEVLCQSIAKNGPGFEDMARRNESGNPEFQFLFGGERGSEAAIAHEYFLWLKNRYLSVTHNLDGEKSNPPSLDSLGDKSSTPTGYLRPAAGSCSPADSDMEMEDDITQLDHNQGVNYTHEGPNSESDLSPREPDVKEQLSTLHNSEDCNPLKEALADTLSFGGSSKLHENEKGLKVISDSDDLGSGRMVPAVHGPITNITGATELPVDSNLEKFNNVKLSNYTFPFKATATAEEINSKKVSEVGSPFRLIQEYTSDGSEIEAESYQVDDNLSKVNLPMIRGSGNLHEENLSAPLPESRVPCEGPDFPPHMERMIKGTSVASSATIELVRTKGEKQLSHKPNATPEAFHRKDSTTSAHVAATSTGMLQKENEEKDVNPVAPQPKLDKFGRLLREDASDSDSDDSWYVGGHRRRGRSWSRSRSLSRSRSPLEKRKRRSPRRSPRRRKEKRSRSRSWSPRNQRSKSRSPTFRRMGDVGCDSTRRDKGRNLVCYNFLRNRCYRGMSCRFGHHEPQTGGSRRNSSKQEFVEVLPSSKTSNISEEIRQVAAEVSDHENDYVKTAGMQLPQDMPTCSFGATRGLNIDQKMEDSLGDGLQSDYCGKAGQLNDHHGIISETSRDVAAKSQPTHVVQEAQQVLATCNEHYQEVFDSDQKPLEHFDRSQSPAKKSDIQQAQSSLSDAALQNNNFHSQQTDKPIISDSADETSKSYLNKLLVSEASPSMVKLPPPPPPPPPPPFQPHSLGANAPTLTRSMSDYNMNSQTASEESFPSYMLPQQHSNFYGQQSSSWTSLPPPPPPPPLHEMALAVSSSFELSQLPPKTDFSSQNISGPYATELPSRSLGGGFQQQAYPPPHGNHQNFSQSVLPLYNQASQQFGGRNVPREDCLTQLQLLRFSASASFPQGNSYPPTGACYQELAANKLQWHTRDNLVPSEVPKSASQIDPQLQQRKPPYSFQQSVADSLYNLPAKTSASSKYPADVLDTHQSSRLHDFAGSRVSAYHSSYASTLQGPLSSNLSSAAFRQENDASYSGKTFSLSHLSADERGVGSFGSRHATSPNSGRAFRQTFPGSGSDQYDPIFDSIEPSSNLSKRFDHVQKWEAAAGSDLLRRPNIIENKHGKEVGAVAPAISADNEEFGETADEEVGAVENGSDSDPVDAADMNAGEIDQLKSPGKGKKSKESRSLKHFKVALAEFVKEVLKPSWRQGNMSKEAFKTIVKKTVDKVSGAMKSHQIPKSRAKINQYIESSQRKLTKLVMGYVDKYVKV